MKRFVILLLTAALLGLTIPPAQAAQEGSTFNTPRPWGSAAAKYKIISTIEARFDNVKRLNADGSRATIHVATYFLDRKSSVDALLRACKRGVMVRVILDGKIEGSAARRLVTTLNADNNGRTGPCNSAPARQGQRTAPDAGSAGEAELDTLTSDQALRTAQLVDDTRASWGADGSYVKSCSGSCRGAGGNMHSKFFTMSNTGGAQFVSMVSSSNLNAGGAVKGWNDLYTIVNRPKTWETFKRIHLEMTDDTRQAGLDETVDGPYTLRFFPMRDSGKNADPVLKDLNQVGCKSGFGRTQVRISQFYWAGVRGMYLANKVIALGKAGCDVRVIYGAPSKQVRLHLRQAAVKNQIQVYDSRKDLGGTPEYDVRTHGKWVAIRGAYRGNTRTHVVMTGSANWVAGSLSRGDETSVNIQTGAAWAAYNSEWNRIRAKSIRIPQRR